MEIIDKLISLLGNPAVTVLLISGGVFGYWVLRNRIENLKEHNNFLKSKLDDLSDFAPDVLVQRLAIRHKEAIEELEILNMDYEANEERIIELKTQKDEMAKMLEKITIQIMKAFKNCEYNCFYCSHPSEVSSKVDFLIEHEEKAFMVDIEAKCRNCGHKTIAISEVSKIKTQ